MLALIPSMPFGAPATNVTASPDVAAGIESMCALLEQRANARNLASEPKLSGGWRLLYSNGQEIVSLARGFPLGFVLGPTYQPLDTSSGFFENQATVFNRYNLGKLSTTVVGDVRLAPPGSLNAVGVVNDRGNRVDVDFQRIVFSLDELFGRPVRLRKILTPNLQDGVAQPANDQTYLSDGLRVTCGEYRAA